MKSFLDFSELLGWRVVSIENYVATTEAAALFRQNSGVLTLCGRSVPIEAAFSRNSERRGVYQ